MTTKHPIKLFISLLLTQLAGGIGALFTSSRIPTWYAHLQKPALNPPSWVFGPVWTVLFILMGVAAFLVWRRLPGPGIRKQIYKFTGTYHYITTALAIFLFQLVLNTLWSFLFFGLQNPGAALIEIVALWLAIFATILSFYKISKVAAYLLIPYLAWVSFASYLNYALWTLN